MALEGTAAKARLLCRSRSFWTLVLQTTGMEDTCFPRWKTARRRRESAKLLRAQASAFSATGNQSLMGFCGIWTILERAGKLPSSRGREAGQDNAVHITTIHQSEGTGISGGVSGGLSQQFNRSDASMSVLLESTLYRGRERCGYGKRAYFSVSCAHGNCRKK